MAAGVVIGPRVNVERYRMRSVPGGYPGDYVTAFERVINGTRYEFCRIAWGDGTVTVRATRVRCGTDVHRWEYVAT